MTIQSERPFSGAKFNYTSRNNRKQLSEVNFSENSTNTVRLFALDFYEVIVDEAEGRINYHLIEQPRSQDLFPGGKGPGNEVAHRNRERII